MPPTFCFLAKEWQLVYVVVSPYKCLTFVLSVAVVLLVVLLVQLQTNGKSTLFKVKNVFQKYCSNLRTQADD